MPLTIDEFEQERKRILRMHEGVLKQARHSMGRKPGVPVVDDASICQSVVDELEAARHKLAEQKDRLADLRRIELAYGELKAQNKVLEETNERLMRQLLQMDDDLAERAELQQIIDMQKGTIERHSRHIRELEEAIRAHTHNLEVMERENDLLRERITRMQEQMQPLVHIQEQLKRETNRLRAQLRQKEVGLLQANEAYESLREEYEAMYVNFNASKRVR